MLQQCYRVLEPGGIVRISTPDLKVVLDLYSDCSTPIAKRYLNWHLNWINQRNEDIEPVHNPIFVLNNFMRDWGHQFIYDKATLRNLLICCGFDEIVDCRLNESKHSPLQCIENAERAPDGLIELETMTLEGRKSS